MAKVVYLEWVDITSDNGSWVTAKKALKKSAARKMTSVGWLIGEVDDCYVLASDYDRKHKSCAGVGYYPKGCVLSITEIEGY